MIRVALAQINPTVGDLKGNREKIIGELDKARRFETDLVLFPELSLTGYPPEDLLFKKNFLRENEQTLKSLLPHTKGLACVVGFVHSAKGTLYNAAAFLEDGRLKAIYYKNHLPNYGVFDEKRYFSAGISPLVVSLKGLKVGVSICEDLWVPKGPPLLEARKGAKLLVNISASPYEAEKAGERRRLFSKRAKQAKAYLLYTNLVGGQDELVLTAGA